MKRLSFESWMHQVDENIQDSTGLSADDLPDACYYDWYEDGTSPSRAAAKAIRNAGGY